MCKEDSKDRLERGGHVQTEKSVREEFPGGKHGGA